MMHHNHNTGNWKMDIILLITNAAIWAVVGMYKIIAGAIVSMLGICMPSLMVNLSLSNFNEGLHTVALILAIIASTITILLAIRNHLKNKNEKAS